MKKITNNKISYKKKKIDILYKNDINIIIKLFN